MESVVIRLNLVLRHINIGRRPLQVDHPLVLVRRSRHFLLSHVWRCFGLHRLFLCHRSRVRVELQGLVRLRLGALREVDSCKLDHRPFDIQHKSVFARRWDHATCSGRRLTLYPNSGSLSRSLPLVSHRLGSDLLNRKILLLLSSRTLV